MAVFNPDYKEVGLQDYRESRPISQFEGDKSLGVLLEGAGKLVSSAASAGDQIIKAKIREDSEPLYALRDERIAELEKARQSLTNPQQFASVQPNTAVDETTNLDTSGDPLSLVGFNKPIPTNLAELPNRASVLETARASGKISNTHFYAAADTLGQQLRNRYGPGYYQYIDAVMTNVLGVDAANARMASLLGDINSYMSSAQAARNQVLKDITQAVEKGYDDAHVVRDYYNAGLITDSQVYSYINSIAGREFKHNEMKRVRENLKEGDAETKRIAENHANIIAADTAFSAMNTVRLREGFPTPQSLHELAQNVRSGRLKLDAQTLTQMAGMVEGLIEQTRVNIRNKFYEPDKSGRTLSRDLSDVKKENEIIENSLSHLKELKAAFGEGNFALANMTKRLNEATSNQAGYDLLQQKGALGDSARLAQAFTVLPPELRTSLNSWFMEKFQAAAPAEFEALRNELIKKSIIQPDMDLGKKVHTLLDSLNQVEDTFKAPQFYKDFLSLIDDQNIGLTSATMAKPEHREQREKLATHIFDPSGWNLLTKFLIEGEETDPVTGQPARQGRYSLWQRLTSPEMVNTMDHVGGKQEANFQAFAKYAFGNHILKAELAEFNKYAADAEGFRWFWNTERMRFEVKRPILPKTGETPDFTDSQEVAWRKAKALESRLEIGLAGLANVAASSGEDVETFLIKTLREFEVNLTGPGVILPQKMRDALELEYKLKLKEEEEKRKKYETGR